MALKEPSYGSLVPSWVLFENFLLGEAVLRNGSDALKREILPGLISLETIGGLAFTETETGSDPTQTDQDRRQEDRRGLDPERVETLHYPLGGRRPLQDRHQRPGGHGQPGHPAGHHRQGDALKGANRLMIGHHRPSVALRDVVRRSLA
jgi:hypothetical protein